MSTVPSLKSKALEVSMFLDWCKYRNTFYNNIYLEEYDWVIKMPLIPKNANSRDKIKLKKFDLTKYTYLLSY